MFQKEKLAGEVEFCVPSSPLTIVADAGWAARSAISAVNRKTDDLRITEAFRCVRNQTRAVLMYHCGGGGAKYSLHIPRPIIVRGAGGEGC